MGFIMLTVRYKTRKITGVPCRLPSLTTVQEGFSFCIECAMKADDEVECAILQKSGSRFGVSRGVDGHAVTEGERLKTCHGVPAGGESGARLQRSFADSQDLLISKPSFS